MSQTIIPTMRYEDAGRMIDWLCNAFGFRQRQVSTGDQGMITHAELEHRGSLIMLGSKREDRLAEHLTTARELGRCTQSAYVIVEDIQAHYERAKAAGAQIVIELREEGYGGAGYAALDPEGQLWYFGTYDPFR